jgi:tetratricopeptide (TPR) repeat protein
MMDNGLHRHRILMLCLVLTIAILGVFWQVRDHGFVNFDDGTYICNNSQVRNGLTWHGVAWAFTTTHANFWHPLTWLSHMLDCEIYGLNPAGHHLTNLLLHMANALLLFLVFHRMTHAVWKSAFVAALFALHPLHVESVAWASERKDVLSTLFWILTMGAYASYVEAPGAKRYLLVLVCFVLGLMAKPMLVALPFVLLLLDYWPLGRWRFKPMAHAHPPQVEDLTHIKDQGKRVTHLLVEKGPLLVFAVAFSIVAFLAQEHGGATKSFASFPMEVRVANALLSYVGYMGKMLWPKNLAVFYPHPGITVTMWQAAMAGLLLAALSVLTIRLAKGRPYLPVGWLWYLGTLVPVIGLVQVGDHSMADRYTYVPLIGLFIVMAWGLPDMLARWPHQRAALATLTAGLLAALVICSRLQVRYWQDSITLFQHALCVAPDNPPAHTNLGVAFAGQGEVEKAIWHYAEALRIEPNYLEARINLGGALAGQGKFDEAIAQYEKALHIKPDFADAHYNLGNALVRHGRLADAIGHYSEALRIRPGDAEAHNNLAIALAAEGRRTEAMAHFRQALRIEPDFRDAAHNLAIALQEADKHEAAAKSLNAVKQVSSNAMASLHK